MYFTVYIPEFVVLAATALFVLATLWACIKQTKNPFLAKLTNKHLIAKRLIFKRRNMYDPKTKSVWGGDHIDWLEEARAYQKLRD